MYWSVLGCRADETSRVRVSWQTAVRLLIKHRHRRQDTDGWIFNRRLNSEVKDLEKEVSVSSGDKRWCGRSESCSRWRTQASVSETAVLSHGSTCVYFKRQLTQSSISQRATTFIFLPLIWLSASLMTHHAPRVTAHKNNKNAHIHKDLWNQGTNENIKQRNTSKTVNNRDNLRSQLYN